MIYYYLNLTEVVDFMSKWEKGGLKISSYFLEN